MAEAVILSIAERIVANLVPRAIEQVGKLWGIKHELKALGNTVSMLQAVLEDAEEQYDHSHQIQDCIEKLKDVFYDAEDVLEECSIEATRRELRGGNEMMKEVKIFFSCSNQLAFILKMFRKVKAVRRKIEAIKADMQLQLNLPKKERTKREETHGFIPKEDVIGRDDDIETVRDFLLNSNVQENVSILPIVGIGGLGKTALAKYAYEYSEFDLKMWVCVSTDFDEKKLVKKMLACAKKEEPTEDTMELLQSELRAEISGKRYLLVLDDVWNKKLETWPSLETLLRGGARGSKILITTRDTMVAEIMGTTQPHSLKGLSESASLELLMQMASRKMEEMKDSDMLAVGEEIVKKCAGVPLVVRVVGSLLFSKKTKSEWLHFKDHELPDVCQTNDSIKLVLKLSYDYLPSRLKQCFAFCSLFPKDYEIKKQTLVDLWLAEGFIQPLDRSQHLEDIAHGYFMDLLWSNFFQDYQKDVETCKMHDLMHDLACSVAGTECWVAWDDRKSIPERTRHISYGSTSNLMGQLLISCSKASPLRTFLATVGVWGWMGYGESVSEADLRQLIQSFKRLRILDLHMTNFEKLPRSICKLKHLTYLNLSRNRELKRLPNSITRLQNLQTLNLSYCDSLEELPRDIRKLVSLRNLDISGCSKLRYVPRGLGQLSSLHRLKSFILPKNKALAKNCCGLEELNGLNNIRGSLCIENLGSVTDAEAESKTANLIGKQSLESLWLKWGNFDIAEEVIGNKDEALLDGLKPPSNLEELTIDGYKGESFPGWMTDGSSLPNLVRLSLHDCKRCKQFPQFGLNKLKRLEIRRMKFLEGLPEEECLKSLTSLESLIVSECPRLTSLSSLGIKHPSNLVHLHIHDCKELDISKDESGNIITLDDSHGGRLLHSLRSVKILSLPKLESLPQWLLQASNLEQLEISHCFNLKELPEQMKALQSLQRLLIRRCPLLTSLPEGMRRLTSLTQLRIVGCPVLRERCKREGGEDWYKIAHIPHISHHPFN